MADLKPMKTDLELMKQALSQLRPGEKENLRFHLQQKTPIICGIKGRLYIDGVGGG